MASLRSRTAGGMRELLAPCPLSHSPPCCPLGGASLGTQRQPGTSPKAPNDHLPAQKPSPQLMGPTPSRLSPAPQISSHPTVGRRGQPRAPPGTHPPLNHSDLASPSPSPRACKTRGGCEHPAAGPKRMGLYNSFERLSRVRGGQMAPKARWWSRVGAAAPCRTTAFGEWEQHSRAQQSWS